MDDKNAGMPRWVKISIVITVLIAALFVVLLLSGKGHGPGRHLPAHSMSAPTLESVPWR